MRFVCSQMFTAYLHGPLAVLKTLTYSGVCTSAELAIASSLHAASFAVSSQLLRSHSLFTRIAVLSMSGFAR